MPKQCNEEGCKYNVFGGGYCRLHQYLRTDKKPKPLKKIGEKGKQRIENKKELSQKDKEFFSEIWEERPHRCFVNDAYLGSEPLTLFFHHVLPKRDYPQFRYEKWNIVLLTWENHSQAEINIDFVPKIKEYRDHLIKTKL